MKTPKVLSGRLLADFIKERQKNEVRALSKKPTLLIIRDSKNPVILKYVDLKIRYGEDIGVKVIDHLAQNSEDIKKTIKKANEDPKISAIILQLPILEKAETDTLANLIAPAKDVDGLGSHSNYDSATATAILWLLAGYDIDLKTKNIAIVGHGKLVGAPLYQMFSNSGYRVETFDYGSDLTKLKNFDIIISATGQPGLILDDYIGPGAILVDAGTASEGGVLKGDLAPEIRERTDLTAITPEVGGVGPLTIACLFDHVIRACKA